MAELGKNKFFPGVSSSKGMHSPAMECKDCSKHPELYKDCIVISTSDTQGTGFWLNLVRREIFYCETVSFMQVVQGASQDS